MVPNKNGEIEFTKEKLEALLNEVWNDGNNLWRRKAGRMNRKLDGIYLRVKRDGKYQPVCLSDMTKEELEENLNSDRGEWLKGAVIHLALILRAIGDEFGLERREE